MACNQALCETAPYLRLSTDIRSFTSDLPIIIVDSFGVDIDNESSSNSQNPRQPVQSIIVDVDALSTTEPEIHVHGVRRGLGVEFAHLIEINSGSHHVRTAQIFTVDQEDAPIVQGGFEVGNTSDVAYRDKLRER